MAAFAVDGAGLRTVELQSGRELRAASVLKPLLAWVAGSSLRMADAALWELLGRRAVVFSDNKATATLWSLCGEDQLLAGLNDRVGESWCIAGDGEHPSLRVMVTAHEVASAFAILASEDTDVASKVRGWMREVPTTLSFGVRPIASATLAVESRAVGVKCGWFGGERAHAVVVVETPGRTVGATVTTSISPDDATRDAVRQASGDDTMLVAVHDRVVGDEIREAVRYALAAASEL